MDMRVEAAKKIATAETVRTQQIVVRSLLRELCYELDKVMDIQARGQLEVYGQRILKGWWPGTYEGVSE